MRTARSVRRAVVDDPLPALAGGDRVSYWRGDRPGDRKEQRLVLSRRERRASAGSVQGGSRPESSIDDVPVRIDRAVPRIDVGIVSGLLDVLVCRVGHGTTSDMTVGDCESLHNVFVGLVQDLFSLLANSLARNLYCADELVGSIFMHDAPARGASDAPSRC